MSEGKTRQQRVRRVQNARAAAERMFVDVEITLERNGVRTSGVPGEEWRAQFYDRSQQSFVAGSGATPWEAIGWAVVQLIASRHKKLILAVNSDDTPSTVLERLSRAVRIAS